MLRKPCFAATAPLLLLAALHAACSGGSDAAPEADGPQKLDPTSDGSTDTRTDGGAEVPDGAVTPPNAWPAWTATVVATGSLAESFNTTVYDDAIVLVETNVKDELTPCNASASGLDAWEVPSGTKHHIAGDGAWTHRMAEGHTHLVYRGFEGTGDCAADRPVSAYSFAAKSSRVLGQAKGSLLTLAGDRALFQEGDNLRGVRITDGQAWTLPLAGATPKSTVAIKSGGQRLVLVATATETFAVDPETGVKTALGITGAHDLSVNAGGCMAYAFSFTTPRLIDPLKRVSTPGKGFSISDDCAHVAWMVGGNVHVEDVATGAMRDLPADGDTFRFSPDGTHLYFGSSFRRADGVGGIVPASPDAAGRGPLAADPAHTWWMHSRVDTILPPGKTGYPITFRLRTTTGSNVDLGTTTNYRASVRTSIAPDGTVGLGWQSDQATSPSDTNNFFTDDLFFTRIAPGTAPVTTMVPSGSLLVDVAPSFGITFSRTHALSRTRLVDKSAQVLDPAVDFVVRRSGGGDVVVYRRPNRDLVAIRYAPL